MRYFFASILAVLLAGWMWNCRYKKEELAQLCRFQENQTGKKVSLPLCLLSMGAWLYDRYMMGMLLLWDSLGKNKELERDKNFCRYQAVRIGKSSKEDYFFRQLQYVTYGWLTGLVICMLCLFLSMKNDIPLREDGTLLQRPEQWEESAAYELQLDGLDERTRISVTINGWQQTDSATLLAEAAETLADRIAGRNTSLEEVYFDLELPETLDGGIAISWDSSNIDVLGSNGTVRNQELEEAELAELTAVLTYQGETVVQRIPVKILPPVRNSVYYSRKLTEQIIEQEERTRTDQYVSLPTEIDGHLLGYESPPDMTVLYLFAVGWVAAFGMVFGYRQQIKEGYRRRSCLLQQEYGCIASRFAILLRCGLPVRSCWQKMVQTYEQEKETEEQQFSYALEEMALTSRQMAGGMQETKAYLEFGNRCELYAYRRFGMLLEQTVRQGNPGLAQLLEGEAVQAMEERKNLARKRAEEAETKMMLPMFLMLGVVIVVVMVPAFMRM